MNVFIFISLYTTFMSFIENLFKSKRAKKIFLIVLLLPLFIISWRRGNTTVDYGNYEYIFITSKNLPLLNGWKTLNIDPGYFLLNKLVSYFSTNFTFFLMIYSSIVLGIYYWFINKYSNNYSMSLILLVAFGSYYTSFNTMRQFLAATICIVAIQNIDKSFFKFLLIILLATTIHSSAIVMVPFYFILKLDITKLKHFIIFFGFLAVSFLVLVYAPNIVNIITTKYYSTYNNVEAFGISTGVPILAVTRILFLFIYSLLFFKMIDFNSTLEKAYFNSIMITLVFMLFSTRVEMFQRFTYFFLPYTIVFIPNLNSKLTHRNTRVFFNSIIFIICLIYIYLTQKNALYLWA